MYIYISTYMYIYIYIYAEYIWYNKVLNPMRSQYGFSSAFSTSLSQGGWPQRFVSADAAQTLREVRWPEEWPYTEAHWLGKPQWIGFHGKILSLGHLHPIFLCWALTIHLESWALKSTCHSYSIGWENRNGLVFTGKF